ncbi:MAG: glycosyltransferase, partial [Thermoguttaceae bacterium]
AIEDVIDVIRPDVVHTLEMQHAAYLVLPVKKKMGRQFPLWFYSCWGSDIKWFEQLPDHKERIAEILTNIDVLFSGDKESIKKAINDYNFNKPTLYVPSPGGYRMDYYIDKITYTPPCQRNIILVNGYSGWVYRPDVVFAALKKCKDQILENKMKIVVFLVGDIINYIDEINALGIEIELFKHTDDYDDVMRLFSRARIYISSSMSNGVPNSMLESMMMGCFPIISITGSTSEFIDNGVNGILLNPEDLDGYVAAIEKSLVDYTLLDNAVTINRRILKTNFDYDVIREKVLSFYETSVGKGAEMGERGRRSNGT